MRLLRSFFECCKMSCGRCRCCISLASPILPILRGERGSVESDSPSPADANQRCRIKSGGDEANRRSNQSSPLFVATGAIVILRIAISSSRWSNRPLPLPRAARAQISAALKAVAAVLNALDAHYFRSGTRDSILRASHGGALSLPMLSELDRGRARRGKRGWRKRGTRRKKT